MIKTFVYRLLLFCKGMKLFLFINVVEKKYYK